MPADADADDTAARMCMRPWCCPTRSTPAFSSSSKAMWSRCCSTCLRWRRARRCTDMFVHVCVFVCVLNIYELTHMCVGCNAPMNTKLLDSEKALFYIASNWLHSCNA